jgi:peptidyl-prolyl cis-trans isomerase A (cyclophilin A)
MPHIPASATATTRTTMTMRPMSTVRLLPAVAVLAAIPIAACAAPFAGPAAPDPARLLQPDHPEMQRTAPDTFEVHFETTQGDFVMEVVREWAPIGADRFYNLARHGYYDGVRFFRVLPGFVVQFGISGDPTISAAWREMRMADDPVVRSNERGYVSYAMAGPDTRTVQVFINLADNSRLDAQGFAPFARVVSGMEVVEALHAGYGEGAPRGDGPEQERIQAEGEAYLEAEFPELDRVVRATVVEGRLAG